jgi:ABC-type transport system involved in multi-copper enzyme maturation permease subunit
MLGPVIASEFIKLRRSRVTWMTLLAFSMGPMAITLFTWIVAEPGRAMRLGLIGTKANLSGISPTWPSVFSMLTLVVGMGGMLLLAFIVAWVFGREYAEGTAKNLLALPVPRCLFLFAKLVVSAAWWIVLTAAVFSEMILCGAAMGLPDLSTHLLIQAGRDLLFAAGAAYLLVPVIAWFSLLGKGYLPPLGFSFGMLALGNIIAKTGWAEWFPWSIVPMLVGSVGKPETSISPGSWAVLAVTFAAGVAAAALQLSHADNTQ